MRIVFAGTPAIAVPSLLALAREHEIVGVLTAPDAAGGRHLKVEPSAVKRAAESIGLHVFQPEKLDSAARGNIGELNPEILVCVAFGTIFGPKFLGLFPRGGINMHPSMLPLLRGPSPISAAILSGADRTGISIQRLAPEMDAGDLFAQKELLLDGTETTAGLTGTCSEAGAELLVSVVAAIEAGTAVSWPQDHSKATYCHLVRKEDGRIDWTADAHVIECMVRAYDPWPRAYTFWNGHQLAVHEAGALPDSDAGKVPGTVVQVDKTRGILVQTGHGLLALKRIRPQNKNEMDFAAFINGARGFLGSLLGG